MSLTGRLTGGFGGPTATGIDRDTAFSVMGNARRRTVIQYVAGVSDDREIHLHDLTEAVAADEYGGDYDATERKAVYIGLYQAHMDRLVSAGVVREERTNVFYKGQNAEALAQGIEKVCEVIG